MTHFFSFFYLHRIVLLSAVCIATTACSNDLSLVYDSLYRIEQQLALLSEEDGATEASDTASQNKTPKTELHLYASGVRYDEDYKWMDEPNPSEGEATLFLLCDGLPVFETSIAGLGCAEEDAHRIVGGRLYYDYCTADSSFVMEEGVLWAKWGGRFAVYDMASAPDGRVLCLRIPRQSSGFVLGTAESDLLSDSGLDPVGEMYLDGSSVCFKVKSEAEYGTVCYNLTSGKAKYYSRSPCGMLTGDYVISDGRQYTSVIEGREGLWVDGVFKHSYEDGSDKALVLECGGSVYSVVENSSCIALYDGGQGATIVDMGSSLIGAVSDGNAAGILYIKEDGRLASYSISTHSKNYIRSSFSPTSPVAIAVSGDRMALSLLDSSLSPAIYEGGEVSLYAFNGCFTHLEYLEAVLK